MRTDVPSSELGGALKALAEAWLRGVDLTACRAGALVANDLEAARRGIEEFPVVRRPQAALEDLSRFWQSRAHLDVLEAIGG